MRMKRKTSKESAGAEICLRLSVSTAAIMVITVRIANHPSVATVEHSISVTSVTAVQIDWTEDRQLRPLVKHAEAESKQVLTQKMKMMK